jgi:Retroviral aspartyl protease/Retrotransposon gag protein
MKYKLSSLFFTGDAREWHRYFKLSNVDPSWLQFKEELIDRFNPDSKNPVDKFKKVQQLGRIKARVISHQYSKEEYYLLGFLSGLKEEIADAVILYNPVTLKHAYKLARQIEKSLHSQSRMRQIEKSLHSQSRMLNPFNKHVLYSPVTSNVAQTKPRDDKIGSSLTDNIKITDPIANPLTLEQKRSLGLCFRCGDRYFSGHKCKGKGLHIIEEENLATDISTHDSSLVEPCYPPDDQALITMCSSQMCSIHMTLKFKGQIGTLNVMAMLDSGSTHFFISSTIMQILNLALALSTPLTVVTASGTKLTTSHLCGRLQFKLQNHSFWQI